MRYAQLTLFTLLFFLPSRLVHAATADTTCGIIWDEPIVLSDTTRDAHSPRIALSGDDTVHVVWVNGGFTKIRLPYVFSIDGGADFSERRELLSDSINYPGNAYWIRVISNGENAYIFFVGSTAGNTPIRMLKSTNAGFDWTGPIDISADTTGIIQSVGIHGDTIAIIYVGPFSERRVLRSSNGGASWTRAETPVNVYSDIAIGSQAMHLLQLEDTTGDTEYRRSRDLGDTWSPRTFISTLDGYGSSDPVIAAGDSLVMTAWIDLKYGCQGILGCSIIGRRGRSFPDSTGFEEERLLTDLPRGSQPSVAVPRERTAVTWVDEVVPNTTFHTAVRITSDSDTLWCPSVDITPTTQYEVIRPVIALSRNAVHVVWEQAVAPSPSTFRIFYRRGRFIETSVRDNQEVSPVTFNLCQNYPNPFNPSTTITYTLDRREFVRLAIYDVLGREVVIPVQEYKEPGEHTVTWQAEGLPTGVYYYRVTAGSGSQTRKAILLR